MKEKVAPEGGKRIAGFEPALAAWKASVLTVNTISAYAPRENRTLDRWCEKPELFATRESSVDH